MIKHDPDLYNVAVKVFLRDGNKLLVLNDGYDGGDLPGGRLNKDEFDLSIEEIINREITEELGSEIKYKLSNPVVLMRHRRNEQTLKDKPLIRIFAIGFEAEYLGGEIKLSHEHVGYEWVDLKSFKPEEHFQGGWLKGIKEYLKQAR